MLTDAQLVEARRFLGYPAFGNSGSGNMGWQYYQAAGLVEYRLRNLSAAEEGVVVQYLATIGELERSILDASGSLDTQQAGEWVRNPHEVAERTRLFDDWRRRFCGFLGVPAGPSFASSNTVRLVV